jgi:hypothetical protein
METVTQVLPSLLTFQVSKKLTTINEEKVNPRPYNKINTSS